MIHAFYVVGEIKKINISESKNPKKAASAVLLVQYGVQRQPTGAVEFANVVMIRVPADKFPQLRAKLTVGKKLQVRGHLQGVAKTVLDENYFITELVADRIYIEDENDQALAMAGALAS